MDENKTLADIQQEITDEKTLIAGVGTLISGLEDQVLAAKGDQAKINQIFTDAKANADALTAALATGTPAANVSTTDAGTPS